MPSLVSFDRYRLTLFFIHSLLFRFYTQNHSSCQPQLYASRSHSDAKKFHGSIFDMVGCVSCLFVFVWIAEDVFIDNPKSQFLDSPIAYRVTREAARAFRRSIASLGYEPTDRRTSLFLFVVMCWRFEW